jgi:hypothetical protein
MMEQDARLSQIQTIMTEFAQRTGLTPASNAPRRYLWTDAFGVCNFLGLYQQTNEEQYLTLALQLVNQVHRVLGRHRDDDSRQGWLSGLAEEAGAKHPTMGGLRIGKQLNEREPGAPVDEILEWDRDGQYYHYLTKWMHALYRVSRVTGDAIYHTWAIELAKAAHSGFVYLPSASSRKRMYWKMSIDLSRPLEPAMGHHDPLDGLINYYQLQERAAALRLMGEIADLNDICTGQNWATEDPLGIGGLLWNSCIVAQLISNGQTLLNDLLEDLLNSALVGLESYASTNSLDLPSDYRLAFREFGLSIGLRGLAAVEGLLEEKPELFIRGEQLRTQIENLLHYKPMIDSIERFWLQPSNRENNTWRDHRDINEIMLATSMAPEGFLTL